MLSFLAVDEARAQSCTSTGLPTTCTGTLDDQDPTDSFFFTTTAITDFTAFSSNFDPDPTHTLLDGADVLLVLSDTLNTLIEMDEDGGGDFLVDPANTSNLLFTTPVFPGFSAGPVFDALLRVEDLPAGDYRLDIIQSSFGGTYRVQAFAVSPE
jgi:hypothetical protein